MAIFEGVEYNFIITYVVKVNFYNFEFNYNEIEKYKYLIM